MEGGPDLTKFDPVAERCTVLLACRVVQWRPKVLRLVLGAMVMVSLLCELAVGGNSLDDDSRNVVVVFAREVHYGDLFVFAPKWVLDTRRRRICLPTEPKSILGRLFFITTTNFHVVDLPVWRG